PDVIVTQTQCEVCAVSPRDLEQALWDWTGARPRVVSLEPNRLEDAWRDILAVAAALDATPAGLGLVARLRRRMEGIARETQGIVHHPTVACVEWIDPLMAAGNWMPELVAMAGGRDLFGRAGEHSPWLGWDELRQADPDVIVIQPCGYDIPRARREMPALTGAAGWDGLRAVGAGRVFLVDGNRYFNRPGPGLVESLEILVELLHPGRMRFGHEGRGWQRL
ncbi:MAG: cobalamin-binding protein, partial [Alphaproteobacteria bacterium]